MKLYGTSFYGNEASDYAKENGYLDYATLAKAFDAVLNNGIMSATADIGYWEQESGFVDNSDRIEEIEEELESLEEDLEQARELSEVPELKELNNVTVEAIEAKIDELEQEKEELEAEQDDFPEVYQWYIVDDAGARILEEINEIVFYNSELDMYLWGVTHYGTSWSYVLTNVKLNCGEDAFN